MPLPKKIKILKRPQTAAQKAANEARRRYALSQKRGAHGKFETIIPTAKDKAEIDALTSHKAPPMKIKNILLEETAPAPGEELSVLQHPVVNESTKKPLFTPKKSRRDDPNASFHLPTLSAEAQTFWNKLKDIAHPNHYLTNKQVAVISITSATVLLAVGGYIVGKSTPPVIVTNSVVITPTPVPPPLINNTERTFSGTLRRTNLRYVLISTNETITLEANNINLAKYVGKRLLARGIYESSSATLTVLDPTELEILPDIIKNIPTNTPEPTAKPTSTRNPFATPTPKPATEPYM